MPINLSLREGSASSDDSEGVEKSEGFAPGSWNGIMSATVRPLFSITIFSCCSSTMDIYLEKCDLASAAVIFIIWYSSGINGCTLWSIEYTPCYIKGLFRQTYSYVRSLLNLIERGRKSPDTENVGVAPVILAAETFNRKITSSAPRITNKLIDSNVTPTVELHMDVHGISS